MWCVFLGIPEVENRHITPDEIHLKNVGTFSILQKPVKVEAVGIFPGVAEQITWRRQILENSNTTTSSENDVGAIRKIAKNKFDQVNTHSNDAVGLPVIAYLGTSRVYGAGRNTLRSNDHRLSRQIFKEGYQDWDEMKATKFHFQEWLATYDTLVGQGREYNRTKEAFFDTVRIANPYLTELSFNNGELWARVDMEGNISDFLPLSLHSDGIHYYTVMVAELAYRCIVLNGFLNELAIIESKGVVMIDELDLHLHPNWQRHVVSDLKRAFPNLQFIVTTRSPFIVQSLESDELINLDNSEVQSFSPDELHLNKVATEIMGVKSVRSEDFESRFKKASEELDKIEDANKALTTEDYIQISKTLGKLIKDETNDPELKAFLDKEIDGENI